MKQILAENLIVTSVMCIKRIYTEGRRKGKESNVGGREGKRLLLFNCLPGAYPNTDLLLSPETTGSPPV